MADVHPFDLRSFDADAEARADLERLQAEVAALKAERDCLINEARREGLELGRREAVERASASEHERVLAETSGLAEQLKAAAAAIREKRGELAAEAERDLVKLALAVAEKIVKAQIALGKPVAEENLRRAVELTVQRREMAVLLHPDDVARIETYLPGLRRDFADIQNIVLQPDPSVGRGGVIVRTREGSVDTTVASQLDQIERGLLG